MHTGGRADKSLTKSWAVSQPQAPVSPLLLPSCLPRPSLSLSHQQHLGFSEFIWLELKGDSKCTPRKKVFKARDLHVFPFIFSGWSSITLRS